MLYADLLDDAERSRIAAENRRRTLTAAADSGWGKGVNPWLPEVQAIDTHIAELARIEHAMVLRLRRAMRAHPLGDWCRRTVGVGEKQLARLLAVIGDPGARPNPAKLWAYCGLHVVPARSHAQNGAQVTVAEGGEQPGDHISPEARGVHVAGEPSGSQGRGDAHTPTAAGTPDPDQPPSGTQSTVVGVAPTRRRGSKANWSGLARTRVYLIAESCIKHRTSPFRVVYDEGRGRYEDAVHQVPCVRCGPSGKPAPIGSPLSAGHQHGRAMRLVMKAILLSLWLEARNLQKDSATNEGDR